MHEPVDGYTVRFGETARRLLATLVFIVVASAASAQQPYVTILVPAQMEVDSLAEILWYQYNFTGPVNIEYSTDSMATWTFIDTASPVGTSGRYTWTVPDDTSSRAYIRMLHGDTVRGRSAQFTITYDPVPIVYLFQPYDAQVLFEGTSFLVMWQGQFMGGRPMVVDYSTDAGATWKVIGAFTGRDGPDSLRWTIPSEPTTTAQIRVRTVDSTAMSRAIPFVIRGTPRISMLYPAGGEVFEVDSAIFVKWTATSLVGELRLEYSVDGGGYWFTLADHDAREGIDSIAWTIPPQPSTNVLVRVIAENGAVIDSSDRPFSIVAVLTSAPDEGTEARAMQRSLRLSPTPSAHSVTVEWESLTTSIATLRMFSADGARLRSVDLGECRPGRNRRIIELGDLPAGTYPCAIETSGATANGVVIVQR